MRQKWRHLLFLHWRVDVDQLRTLIPAKLEIDTFEGQAYIGLVPFTMLDVHPVWAPSVPALSNFHETNVRTYVHYRGAAPGVWFFSLDAANSIAVRVARSVWKLPYHFASMQMDVSPAALTVTEPVGSDVASPDKDHRIAYCTERLWPEPLPAVCSVDYTTTGTPGPAAPGTLEHFLAERYILYTKANRGLLSGQVHHAPYPLQTATVYALDENMIAAAGIVHGPEAPLAHYALGVDVDIYPLLPVAGAAGL
jgi:uncharacterized protein YqjF (DUF2071 family)